MRKLTTFEDIFSQFLSKITDYELGNLVDEEFQQDLENKLKVALTQFSSNVRNSIEVDYTSKTLSNPTNIDSNGELTPLEINCLVYWMLYGWVSPYVNNEEVLKMGIASQDYEKLSRANHLDKLKATSASIMKEAKRLTTRYGYVNLKKRVGKK